MAGPAEQARTVHLFSVTIQVRRSREHVADGSIDRRARLVSNHGSSRLIHLLTSLRIVWSPTRQSFGLSSSSRSISPPWLARARNPSRRISARRPVLPQRRGDQEREAVRTSAVHQAGDERGADADLLDLIDDLNSHVRRPKSIGDHGTYLATPTIEPSR
jgi:hypothetical protein